VIPTMILFGLVAGHWPRAALLASAALWPIVLVAGNVMDFEIGLVAASLLALANTAVGVLVHHAIRRTFGLLRRVPSPS
jgi:hypothetical protein